MHYTNTNAPVITTAHAADKYDGQPSIGYIETIVQLNNMGAVCIDATQLADADHYLRRALKTVNDVAFFSFPGFDSMNTASDKNKRRDISKNLYLYQREEYDEGMSVHSEPIQLDISASLHSARATIFYNLGQLCMDDEA